MQIWVDADACPNAIKEILFRAANRLKIVVTLVANHVLRSPPSPFIKRVQVSAGFDIADNYIVQYVQSGDLVITADLPLAGAVIDKGCTAINPRGTLYSSDNIKQCLTMRNFNESLRSSGILTGGPAQMSKKEIQAFANTLDRFLFKNK